MSNYLYITSGLLGLGGVVMYLKPEIKEKVKRESIKQSLLAIDTLQTTYQATCNRARSFYTRITGQEGARESTRLPPLNLHNDFNNHSGHDETLTTKLELISNGGFRHQKIIHDGNHYDLLIPNGLEFNLDELLTTIENGEHKFEGWLSTEIDVYDADGNLLHQSGEILSQLEKLLFTGNILPITSKYNYFWIDYFGWNHQANIKKQNLEEIVIRWKIITEDADEIELDSHLVIVNNKEFHLIEI